MRLLKQAMAVLGTVVVIAVVVALVTPKTAHALVATAVQVVNTPGVFNIDEPARIPYFISGSPTCPEGNDCFLTGTAVPAGKRLRVTRIEGILPGTPFDIFAALIRSNPSTNSFRHLVAFPVTPFNAFFDGGGMDSFDQQVDYIFAPGETPVLETGANFTNSFLSSSFFGDYEYTIVGYLVDCTGANPCQ